MRKLLGILFWVAIAALATFLIYLIYDQYKPEDLHLFGSGTSAASLINTKSASQSVANSAGEITGTDEIKEEDDPGKAMQPTPGIELADLEGQLVNLSNFKGKTVFINFWAMGSPSCIREMGELDKAAAIFNERGDAVIITVNKTDTRADIIKFFADNGFNLPVLIDDYGKTFYSYGVNSVPVTFVVDAEGYAHGYIPSATTASTLTGIAEDMPDTR